jgi:quaternary ammonium compound-resistance protein SugE
MSWIYLIIAGCFEIGWPLGFKLSQVTSYRILWITFSTVSMALSGIFLWMAQKQIPIGTAYAVWTGIGAAGTAILGMAVLGDSAAPLRLLCIALIVGGVIGLKLVSGNGG